MSSTCSTVQGARGRVTSCVRGACLRGTIRGRRRYLMVAGATCRTVKGGGLRRATAARGTREGGEGQRCPGEAQAHPERGGADGEVGEGRRRRQSCSACGGRSGGRTDGGDDSGDPATIPCTRTRRTTWRSFCPASICSAVLHAATMRQRAQLGRGHGG